MFTTGVYASSSSSSNSSSSSSSPSCAFLPGPREAPIGNNPKWITAWPKDLGTDVLIMPPKIALKFATREQIILKPIISCFLLLQAWPSGFITHRYIVPIFTLVSFGKFNNLMTQRACPASLPCHPKYEIEVVDISHPSTLPNTKISPTCFVIVLCLKRWEIVEKKWRGVSGGDLNMTGQVYLNLVYLHTGVSKWPSRSSWGYIVGPSHSCIPCTSQHLNAFFSPVKKSMSPKARVWHVYLFQKFYQWWSQRYYEDMIWT